MKIAYFDCFSGISGDMILGAFINAGLKRKTLEAQLAKLRLGGYTLTARSATRGGLRGTRLKVTVTGKRPPRRTLEAIVKRIERSRLPAEVKRTAVTIFETLGRAEAKVHSMPLSKVHFHEAGAVDSIIDIVGAAIGLHELEIEQVTCSPIALGCGLVNCEHGTLPVPVPAVVELLKGKPTIGTTVPAELTTPTGAAIVAALANSFGEQPPILTRAVGTGLGTRDNEQRPNALRVFIGETVAPANTDRILEVEANIDDMSPEVIGYLFDCFFEAGALDVYATPIYMKKNRPATKISVLTRPDLLPAIEAVFFAETSSFGIRVRSLERKKLQREERTIQTHWGPVAVVSGRLNGRVIKQAPEYEACRAIARKRRVPIRAVYDEVALVLARSRST